MRAGRFGVDLGSQWRGTEDNRIRNGASVWMRARTGIALRPVSAMSGENNVGDNVMTSETKHGAPVASIAGSHGCESCFSFS
jgi:hypothetical protein